MLDVAKKVLNVAGYRFFPLEDPQAIRLPLRDFARDLGLRGTVLLGSEGVNIMLAGSPEQIETMRKHFFETLNFPEFEWKESWSSKQPFSRMLVKVKQEIVSTGHRDIDATSDTAKFLKPSELKRWYDEGEDFVIYDTRNDYEIRLGKFRNAQDLKVKNFRSFLEKVGEAPEEIKNKKVVTYCTGGIRCEKGTGVMLKKHGFKDLYQLEGGILKYFEEVGGAHWEGECFVFDKRVGIAPSLEETPTEQCFACRSPLTLAEQSSEQYNPPESCPYCYQMTPEERLIQKGSLEAG